MRGRDTPEIQAVGELCGNLAALGAGVYVVWSTAVAFAGGTFPLTGVTVHGGIGLGLLWAFVADPLVASVAVLCTYLLVAARHARHADRAGRRRPRRSGEHPGSVLTRRRVR